MTRRFSIAAQITLAAALLGASPVASAQPAAPAAAKSASDAQQRRDKIKQRIRALRAYTLTEELELDEATAGKLFPALAKYDDEFDRLLHARADLQRRLEAADGDAAAAIDKLVDEAAANQRAIWDTETRRLDQLRKILTPKQVARILIVLPALERKLQDELRKVVQKSRVGAGAAPSAGAGSGKAAGSSASTSSDVPGATGVIDPFDRTKHPKPGASRIDQSALEDPFASERAPAPAKKRPRPAPAPPTKFCDPFASKHGCK
jgi:hypothetical protein